MVEVTRPSNGIESKVERQTAAPGKSVDQLPLLILYNLCGDVLIKEPTFLLRDIWNAQGGSLLCYEPLIVPICKKGTLSDWKSPRVCLIFVVAKVLTSIMLSRLTPVSKSNWIFTLHHLFKTRYSQLWPTVADCLDLKEASNSVDQITLLSALHKKRILVKYINLVRESSSHIDGNLNVYANHQVHSKRLMLFDESV